MTKKNHAAATVKNPQQHTPTTFSISIHEIYPLEEFRAQTGLSDSAMRAARRKGLRVLRAGKRAYVWGQDFLEYLTGNSSNQA